MRTVAWWCAIFSWLCTATAASAGQLDVTIVGSSTGAMACTESVFRAEAQAQIDYHMAREPYKSRVADIAWHIVWTQRDLGLKRSATTSRLILVNQASARDAVLAAGLPVERGLVIACTTSYGGSGGAPFAVTYRGTDGRKVGLHEFGHTLGLAKDEYNLTSGSVACNDAQPWVGQCWRGCGPPPGPEPWATGCYAPNLKRQKVQKPDGTWTNSVMYALSYPQFNQKTIELIHRALDTWVAAP